MIRISKPPVNIREKLAELERPIGLNGQALLATDTPQQAFDLLGARNRNRVINGDCRIDQRNGGASVTPNNSYTLDRWKGTTSQTSKYTVQQSSTAPTGFKNSLLVTSSSDYSLTSSDYFAVGQYIEGFNIADLGWGAAGASSVTISFWVRSSLTGSFGGSLRNSSYNRSYPFIYTISSANTFEYKTVTVAGDTTGTWSSDNSSGIEVLFGLGVGSTFSGTAGSWSGSNFLSATGATSVVGTSGATFYITGVQLEERKVATPFEYRSYGQELALCQRYFWKTFDGTTYTSGFLVNALTGNAARIPIPMTQVQMRAIPSITVFSSGGTSGQLSEFSSTITRTVSAIGPQSTIGGGYADVPSLGSQPVRFAAYYSAEL